MEGQLIAAALLLVSLYGLFLEVTRKAVFYYDKWDLGLAFTPWALFFVGYQLAIRGQEVLAYLVFFLTAGAWLYSVWLTLRYNRWQWLLALPVLVAKIILSFVYVVSWMDILNANGKDDSQKSDSRSTAMIVVGLLSLLVMRLVNGPAVYEARGWRLSVSKTMAEDRV